MKKAVLAAALGSIFMAGTATASEIERDAYFGAELGGNFLLGDQVDADGEEATFDYWNMFKVGADASYEMQPGLTLLVGGEVRYAFGGVDDIGGDPYVDGNTDVERLTVGLDSAFGTTTMGVQCGIMDSYMSFADLSKEHGLDAQFDELACTDQMLQHTFVGGNFDAGVSYDTDSDAYGLAGSYTFNNVQIGGAFMNLEDEDSGHDIESYTLGTVAEFGKISVAGKYTFQEIDGEEETGYAASASYALNEKTSLSTSYNVLDFNEAHGDEDDQWGTVGASYAYTKNVEFVTEYKFGSNEDDMLFLRANVNY